MLDKHFSFSLPEKEKRRFIKERIRLSMSPFPISISALKNSHRLKEIGELNVNRSDGVTNSAGSATLQPRALDNLNTNKC